MGMIRKRLTENDINRIVRRVIREQQEKDIENELVKCCKSAGIKDIPISCATGDKEECIQEIGEMIAEDPIGMALKGAKVLKCMSGNAGSPVHY